MTRLEGFREALLNLLADALTELDGDDLEQFISYAVDATAAAVHRSWDEAVDRPRGWA